VYQRKDGLKVLDGRMVLELHSNGLLSAPRQFLHVSLLSPSAGLKAVHSNFPLIRLNDFDFIVEFPLFRF
jgi:hypothetical protein